MRLSKNFTLEEFLISQTAERYGINMHPPELIVDNLRRLVEGCLQPLRDESGPIFISSGYRPKVLNERINGSSTSQHINGNAADFSVSNMTPYDTCELIIAMELPFDQVINEFGRWTHLGVADVLRGSALTAHRVDGAVKYVHGIKRMEELM